MSPGVFSAYIQFPFCQIRCSFCCWTEKFASSELLHVGRHRNRYVEALKREIRYRAEHIDDGPMALKVLHLGGGTPSLMHPEEIEDVLTCLTGAYKFSLDDLTTIAIEANPGDLNAEKLSALKKIGINRVSLGVQTFNPHLLKKLNRPDKPETILETYRIIREQGFEDVSFDLLSAFPGQTMEDMKADYEIALSLEPDQIQTFFWRPVEGKLLKSAALNEPADYSSWWKYTHHLLQDRGYENYCYRLYAKPGKESLLHLNNAAYVRPFLAFGPGTFQYLHHETEPDIKAYMERESFDGFYRELDNDFAFFRYVFSSNIKMAEGIHIPTFNQRFQKDIIALIQFRAGAEKLMDEFDRSEVKSLQDFKRKTEHLRFLKKLQKWLNDGILFIENDYLRINFDEVTPYELWG